jgi:(R,R)-butanediol dehydrogenase/meso-butanediol dehydrogenase/diacetyl reductase
MVTGGGRVLAVGIPKEQAALDIHSLVFREITLETTLAHVCDTDLSAALEVLAGGTVGNEFAEAPVGLDQLTSSLDRLAAGAVAGKILIDPGI